MYNYENNNRDNNNKGDLKDRNIGDSSDYYNKIKNSNKNNYRSNENSNFLFKFGIITILITLMSALQVVIIALISQKIYTSKINILISILLSVFSLIPALMPSFLSVVTFNNNYKMMSGSFIIFGSTGIAFGIIRFFNNSNNSIIEALVVFAVALVIGLNIGVLSEFMLKKFGGRQ